MSSGILGHSRFEELCALASVGQISPSEYEELSGHMRHCADCRESYAELFHLTHTQLPLVAAEELPAPKPSFLGRVMGKDYKARFVARARERGLEISGTPGSRGGFWTQLSALSLPRVSYQYASVAAIIVLLGTVGLLSHRWKDADARKVALSAQVSKLSEQNAALQEQVKALSQGKQTVETDLLNMRNGSTALAAHLRELEEQVNKDNIALQSLQAQLDAANDHGTQTERKLREAQQTLLAVNQEITKLRASRANDEATVTAQQLQIADLSRRAKEQEEVIDKQQKLLAVDEDVRNLMAARGLHITDVFDVDGKGKRKAAFGRVFYTEGKSLIFYAFDLEGPKAVSGKHSFQAWGQLADSSTSAVSLGIFYVDDPAQKRWTLRFDNPEVLKRINAVFVTAELHGGAPRPTGQKLMYAYLGHEPNHP